MKSKRRIILASQSFTRRAILKQFGIPFRAEVSGFREDLSLRLNPIHLAMHFALGKAKRVARKHHNAIILGADTVVVLKGKVFGKPKDARDATRILRALSGKTHTIITGYALIDTKSGHEITRAVRTHVTFRKLSTSEIAEYVSSGRSFGKAGGYAVHDRGALFVKEIQGDFYNVAGLPIADIVQELKKLGAL